MILISAGSLTAGVEFLTGELPGNLPEAMPALQTLSVSGTGLGGAVPSAWFEPGVWEALSDLTLYNNSALTGASEPWLHEVAAACQEHASPKPHQGLPDPQ